MPVVSSPLHFFAKPLLYTQLGMVSNLLAHPAVTVEVGPETYQAMATVIAGEERDRLYARQADLYPQFADYQRRTSRTIPVIALERKGGS